eukprot:symbB.v1.2.007836.t1/scaffold463.1/size291460/17
MQRVDQLTPRSQEAEPLSRSLTPHRSPREDLEFIPRREVKERPPAQERSKVSKQVFLKTMGLDQEEWAKCNGSLAAQATLLLQRRREARQLDCHGGAQRPNSIPPRTRARVAKVVQHLKERTGKVATSETQPVEATHKQVIHEKVHPGTNSLAKGLAVDDVLLGFGRKHKPETTEEVCLAGDDAKEKDEDTDTVPMPGFTLHISRLPLEATDASLRKMCQCFGLQVVRVRRPSNNEAEVLLGPLAEPERSRRTRLLAGFLESRALCKVDVCGGFAGPFLSASR